MGSPVHWQVLPMRYKYQVQQILRISSVSHQEHFPKYAQGRENKVNTHYILFRTDQRILSLKSRQIPTNVDFALSMDQSINQSINQSETVLLRHKTNETLWGGCDYTDYAFRKRLVRWCSPLFPPGLVKYKTQLQKRKLMKPLMPSWAKPRQTTQGNCWPMPQRRHHLVLNTSNDLGDSCDGIHHPCNPTTAYWTLQFKRAQMDPIY